MIQAAAPLLLVVPFILLLGMIATGPILYHHFWENYYPYIASGLAFLVMSYYVFFLGNTPSVVYAVVDYIEFIALISALYMVSGGICIKVDKHATPLLNVVFLWIGAILSNFIGTTGASILLIRPYIRLNKGHIAPYHIIFFIFMVSNVGGVLTPIADPPLVLGFLKGVPFLWTLQHCFLPWLFALGLLSGIFYIIDRKTLGQFAAHDFAPKQGKITIIGKRNLLLFPVIILAMFLDPNLFSWVPTFVYHGHKISFIRELILIGVTLAAYWIADKKACHENAFSLAPLQEVVFLFIGIFGTMIPAIELIGRWAHSDAGKSLISPSMLYWATGMLSSVLDNAPTYVNFLTAGMGAQGLSIENYRDVAKYAQEAVPYLRATSLGAVFFGAMSYIGNGPNFMVRAIAEEQGIKMPSFGSYIVRYALPFLFPVLVAVGFIFITWGS